MSSHPIATENVAQQPEGNVKAKEQPSKKGFSGFLEWVVNPDKKKAASYLLAMIVGGVATFAFDTGLEYVKGLIIEDPKEKQLQQIQASSDAIQTTVDDIKTKLASNEPFDPSTLLEKLDFIAQQNSSLLPVAQGLANANSGYVRGAKVSQGPFDGVGSFYMNLNHGKSAGMTQLCGNATVTYNPVQQMFRLDHGGSNDRRYITNPGALRLHGINVVVHADFDSNGSLQLTYDCGKKNKA